VVSMQEWLGFSDIKPDANVHALLCMVADRAELALHPVAEGDPKETVVDPDLTPKQAPSIAGAVVEPGNVVETDSMGKTGPVGPSEATPIVASDTVPSFPKLAKTRIQKLANA